MITIILYLLLGMSFHHALIWNSELLIVVLVLEIVVLRKLYQRLWPTIISRRHQTLKVRRKIERNLGKANHKTWNLT